MKSLEAVLAKLAEDATRHEQRYGNSRSSSKSSSGVTAAVEEQCVEVVPATSQLDLDLHAAAAASDLAGVHDSLMLGANPNTTTCMMGPSCAKATPLVVASVKGDGELASRLLQQPEVNPNIGSYDEINRARINQTALMWAARLGHMSVVNALVADPRVDVNAITKNRFTALMIAAQQGHAEVCQVLLQHERVDVQLKSNITGGNCFFYAMLEMREAVVRIILSDGRLDVNQIMGSRLSTPLVVATRHNGVGIVRLLLEHHADLNVPDGRGDLALDLAIDNHSIEIIRCLLAKGAETSRLSATRHAQWLGDAARLAQSLSAGQVLPEDDLPALHAAALQGDAAEVELCLNDAATAAATLLDGGNMPAVIYAVELGHKEVAALLLLKGHGLSHELVESFNTMMSGTTTSAGTAIFPGQRAFWLIHALISMGALESGDFKAGAMAILRPFCGSLLALRFFESMPHSFESIRGLCEARSAAIYARIDESVTQPVIAHLASVAKDGPTSSIRQDDPGLVPTFEYYFTKSKGQRQSVDVELCAAKALALLALALADIFAADMQAAFADYVVHRAPPKNCQRMMNKLLNPTDHGDPAGTIPRPAKNVDIIRSCVVVPRWEDVEVAYGTLQRKYRVLRVKNAFREGDGFKTLLVNFAYAPGIKWGDIFGAGRFDSSVPGLDAGHVADDAAGGMWLDYIKSLPQFPSWAWALQALWNIAGEQPEAEVIVAAEVQVMYEPYMLGRAQSHVLFKIARCATGPAEMVRDFYEEFLAKHVGDEAKLSGVRAIAATVRSSGSS